MFSFILDLVTEPLGLPIAWYYEWLVLGLIGTIAYEFAYKKTGNLYRSGLHGRTAGSLVHWTIRAIAFIVLWAIVYGVILVGKFALAHKVLACVIFSGIVTIVVILRIVLHKKQQKRLEDSLRELGLK